MSSPEPQTTPSETVRKHKEFLFPAVTTHYQEPLALVRGKGTGMMLNSTKDHVDELIAAMDASFAAAA
jgi:hypothetical protein